MQIGVRALVLLASLAILSGCSSMKETHSTSIALASDSQNISGWISVKGEWALFPTKIKRSYSPYNKAESEKCVSLINGTGIKRSEFLHLQGKKVVVNGVSLKYEDLKEGEEPYQRLLSKRFYESEVVENFCLREFVFLVANVREYR